MHIAVCRKLFDRETVGFTPELLELRSWTLFTLEFPVVDVGFNANGQVNIRTRMIAEDYNDRPPAVELLAPDGTYLKQVKRDPAGVFNPGAHPATGRPFICMRGTREYHEHPSHRADLWEAIKSKYSLGLVLTQIWSAWKTRSK